MFSSQILGYAISDQMTADLAVGVLRASTAIHPPDGVVIVHADPGAQFRARSLQAVLRAAGLKGSMAASRPPAATPLRQQPDLLHQRQPVWQQ